MAIKRLYLLLTCISVTVAAIMYHVKSGCADPIEEKGAAMGRQGYYTQIFCGTLGQEEKYGEVKQMLRNNVAVVGTVKDEERPPWLVRSSNSVYSEEPYVFVPGHRYLILRGRLPDGVEEVRIIDCDRSAEEAHLQRILTSAGHVLRLPPLDTRKAALEDMKGWASEVNKLAESGKCSTQDVVHVLGNPTAVSYDVKRPLEALLKYCVREGKAVRVDNSRGVLASVSYPVIVVRIDGEKVIRIEVEMRKDEQRRPGSAIYYSTAE
jgi:hypothetical protein